MINSPLVKNYKYEKFFIVSLSILFILFITGFIHNSSGDQSNIFFIKTNNYMADYYNVINYSSSQDPYLFGQIDNMPHEHAYPPLTYVVFYLLSKLAGPFNLLSASSAFFMFIFSAMFYLFLFDSYKGEKVYKFAISTLMMLSSIFIFSYERGNTIILTSLLTSFFVLNYNSENKVIKELSFIALAVAAALKAYPAVLGILLIFDKKYKEAFRLIIYGLIFSFFPFVLLNGSFSNIPIWLKNLTLNSNAYNYGIFPRFNFRFWASHISDVEYKTFIYGVFSKIDIILSVVALVMAFFQKQWWKKIMQLLLIAVILPVNSAEYTGLYLFIGMILFFNEENHNKFDWIYLILFILILNPFQVMYNKGQVEWNITVLMMNLSASILFLLLIGESIINFINFVLTKPKSLNSKKAVS